jgi:hypothetical protein
VIALNFEASCQQIIGLESEILWEAHSTPTCHCRLVVNFGININSRICFADFRKPRFQKKMPKKNSEKILKLLRETFFSKFFSRPAALVLKEEI